MSDAVKLTAGLQTDPRLGEPPYEITALVQVTAGTIVLFDGTDASGTPLLASSTVGTAALNFQANARTGLFAVLTGGATGSVHTS